MNVNNVNPNLPVNLPTGTSSTGTTSTLVSTGNISDSLKDPKLTGAVPKDSLTAGSTVKLNTVNPSALGNNSDGDISQLLQVVSGSAKQLPPGVAAAASGVGAFIQTNNMPQANDRFAAMLGDIKANGMPIDVNDLIQAVLRESYTQTTADLGFHAQKVKYFNECKKVTRTYIQELRDFKTSMAKEAKAQGFNPGDPPGAGDADFARWVEFQKDFINDHQKAASHGGAAAGLNSMIAQFKGDVAKLEAAGCSGPGIASVQENTPSAGWTTITDKDGYVIETNVPAGDVVNIKGPNGETISHIWGDPHVTENGNSNALAGAGVFHFGEDSTFILPNGTKVAINTVETPPAGSGIYYSKGVDVLSGTQRGSIGKDNGGNDRTAGLTEDRASWDLLNADSKGNQLNKDSGAVFAWDPETKQWAMQADDGNFYDVADQTWDSYLTTKGVSSHGPKVNVSAAVMAAANSDANLRIAQQASEQFTDTSAGAVAGSLGLPSTVPPAGCTTMDELDNAITKYEEKLSTIGDDAQLANIDLQNMLQKQQQVIQMMSNISKMLSDTALSVIRKIG